MDTEERLEAYKFLPIVQVAGSYIEGQTKEGEIYLMLLSPEQINALKGKEIFDSPEEFLIYVGQIHLVDHKGVPIEGGSAVLTFAREPSYNMALRIRSHHGVLKNLHAKRGSMGAIEVIAPKDRPSLFG